MQVRETELAGVVLFEPIAHRDDRGWFSRTFDATIARAAGLDPDRFIQDSQSRSVRGALRGLHGRVGTGEAKLVRCAHGAIYDVIVDARPDSPTFGRWEAFQLDDQRMQHLYIPPGFLHGFQALTDTADTCYRIDAVHNADEDVAACWNDAELGIPWPLPISTISDRDRTAGPWSQLHHQLQVRGAA